jgi:PAS domain S-box-containing protein
MAADSAADAAELLERFRGLIERSDDLWARTSLRLVELTDVSRRVASADNVHEAVEIVSSFLFASLNAAWIYVGLVDRHRGTLTGALSRREQAKRTEIDIPLDDVSAALVRALRSSSAVSGSDAAELWGMCERCDAFHDLGPHVIHPIHEGLGVVAVEMENPGWPSADEALALDLFLGQLGVAIETALLYRRLRREQSFRASVTDSISSGLITIDRRGRVTGINAAAADLLGLEAVSALDRSIQELWRSSEKRTNPLLDALSKGRPVSHKAVRLNRADGKKIEVDVKVSILRTEPGPYSGVVAELTDTSRIRKMEDEIYHLEKLAALGRLTTSVAHEIRNPLAGIVTGVQYLAKSIPKDDPRGDSVQYILNEIMRLDRIIVDLYSISRPTPLFREEIAPTEIVDRAMRSLSDLSQERGVAISVVAPRGLPQVYVDADKIQQVLINFIKNALEVSAEGTTISIRLMAANRFAAEGHPENESPSHLLITVEDQGPGIPAEDLPRLFEPFFSRKEGGTGLGLYVSHGIIERHGGEIEVDSTPGEGTRVTLELPLESFPPEEAL